MPGKTPGDKKEKKIEEQIIPPCLSDTKYGVPTPGTGKKHAILFGGPKGNFQYDIANMRDLLTKTYGFIPGNIHILLDDGQDQAETDVKNCLPASRENLDDLLFSYTKGGKQ